MSRASAGFADFFPNAPSVLKSKRKEPSPEHQPTRAPLRTESPPRSDKAVENAAAAGPRRNNDASAEALEQQHQPEEDDGAHRADSGDLLTGVGSASSLCSTASSVFSSSSSSRQTMSYPGPNTAIHALTPLTNTESSPPEKTTSPRPSRISNDHMSLTNTATYSAPPPGAPHNVAPAEAITPATTPPQTRKQARPGPGEEKGFTVIYDPALDPKIPSNERHKRKATYRNIPRDDIAAPPDPRLAIAGYTTGAHNAARGLNKARLRPAPYTVKQYTPDKNTIGPQPATRILVTGLDPFTPEMQIRTFFSSFGSIAEFDNKIDPATGSFLGICSIRYADGKPTRQDKYPLTGAASAKLAEKEGNGHRIQLRQIKVELDREGRRAARCVDAAVQKNRVRQQKEEAAVVRKTADTTPVIALSEPPPDAPKGPSGKGGQGPRAPHVVARPIRPEHALVENDPIVDKIKRKPYIFIAHCYVPVLGTTIPHLKKRLKLYSWQEVRLDRTGYYIIFEDSKRGEDECERCYQECNMQALFTYVMNMECEKYGNPNYVRSPSPERVLAEKKKKEIEEEVRREEEQDLEEEKKERAENLDPVTAAKERLYTELLEQVMSDIKTRIAAPAIYDYLDPARHVARRKELGVRDPTLVEAKTPTVLFSAAETMLPHKSKFGKGNKNLRKSLAANLSQNQRRGKGGHHQEVNAFADERRRKPPPKKHNAFRNLHRQMQSFDDEDSDDEQSTLTRDTEEQESRSISRMSSAAPEEEEEVIQIRPSKRRKLDPLWGDADTQDAQARRLFPHLINKDPTDMADGELDQVVHAFPHTSDLYKRAKSELKFRKIQRDAALVFGGEDEDEDSRAGSVQPPTEAATPVETVEGTPVETPEPEVAVKTEKKKPTKPKKKPVSKKQQALMDEKLEPSPLKSEIEETPPVESVLVDEVPRVAEVVPENLISDDPIWGFSIDEPRSTVEEKLDYVMDIDGWQFTVKDAEDLRYLSAALENVRPTSLGEPNLFAYKEKHVKKLNTGLEGVAYKEVKIEDYYKPNATGCARTEGVKKILEKEKSKYLPHRIRVQKAREEREALAKTNPNALAQMAKPAVAPKTSTTTSRSNRANNRRLVNEISTQKQALAADGSENIAIRFNQLKKRKKLVKFDRSAIHNWGLYAQEDISANDMIIEYVGEKVRQKVADIREIKYEKQGVGSSYLFRIDEDSVVDATKKGGIARFINHSCTPNCTAKIIRVDGTKRIVIYALRDIKTSEELTYDYKFERELGSDDRIPCLCGSVNCKGFLN